MPKSCAGTTAVSIGNLAAEIVAAVREYTEEVSEAVAEEVDHTSKAVYRDAKEDSPILTGEYRKGWRRTKSGSGGDVRYTIHQKQKPQLAHLLEYGHAKTGGGRVAGRPHLRPAYDKHVPEMEDRIRDIIKRGGK